ncbi:putative N-acetyl-gamma-glutamyl-phosphate reductase, chloroplastic [Gossypium australe]|uniref:Putative N-acetyl-gamma-glutamyl-phosphate reductase, chloroplastic n=1 Tax=Gossypium australe TaxID=47621 RepID=A0A5B6WQR9_9ROSI|nr:putative N-acetyl-gamma-glutamyl-phosphate reductase, chloroplastic [Gossypium australe]
MCQNQMPLSLSSSVGLLFSMLVGSPVEDDFVYRSIVRALQYIVITRPDIAFAVKYLQNTLDHGLVFTPASKPSLEGYSDANWGTDVDDRRLTTSFMEFKEAIGSFSVDDRANPVLHSKFKHVEFDLFFIREKIVAGTLQVGRVPSQDQVVDILTKPLWVGFFTKFRNQLRVLSKIDELQLTR